MKANPCHSPTVHHSIQWSRPLAGFLKCNFDASLLLSQNTTSFGIIIHDSNGKFVVAKNGVLHYSMNPALAEALSCREALSWLKELDIDNVLVETECLGLHLAITNSSFDATSHGVIIQDCLDLLSNFDNNNFCFARRSANQLAHLLAQAIGFQIVQEVWLDSPPLFISDVMALN